MAGSLVVFQANRFENEIGSSDSQLSQVINQWRVRYSRFINFSSLSPKSTHPSLTPIPTVQRKRFRGGTWISSSPSADASLSLISDQSTSSGDVILALSLRSKVLEEHYISKLHFSWPQVSCLSGYPAKGSRSIFASYRDNFGQIQKFALQFSNTSETEKFINILKDLLERAISNELPCPEFKSTLSSQADFIPSDGPEYRPELDSRSTNSVQASSHLMLPGPKSDAFQDSIKQGGSQSREHDETPSAFPPSFTSYLMNCGPGVKPTESKKVDLKTQFMELLGDSTFRDILATVEEVITKAGDDFLP